MMIKYFNRCYCHMHINLIFDILIRHGVIHLVYCDVVVELDRGLSPISQFGGAAGNGARNGFSLSFWM